MWCTSNDPDYDRKVADVTGLYLEPPPGEVVLSIDEKTQMQALSRRVALRRAQPGRLGRQESDYDRHGTRCLLACFNVRTGKVVGRMSAITLWRGVSVTVLPGEASPWMRTIAALAQELSTDPHDDREPDGKPSGWARSRSCGPKPPHKATWGGGGACEAARRPGPAAGSATIGKRGRHTYVHGNTALPQGPPGPVHAPEGLQTPVERDVPQCSGDIAGVFRGSA
jgi:hypothetical protein